MTARGWQPDYVDGIPARMVWDNRPDRTVLACPRTWPHEPHGPWYTGVLVRPGGPCGHDCPGAPLPVTP